MSGQEKMKKFKLNIRDTYGFEKFKGIVEEKKRKVVSKAKNRYDRNEL
jgi:hypothetical protein